MATSTAQGFYKLLRIGTYETCGGARRSVFVEIEFGNTLNPTRALSLSFTGVEGPHEGGNVSGCCGQISMHWTDEYLAGIRLAPGWTLEMLRELRDRWKQYHMEYNDDIPAEVFSWIANLPSADKPLPGCWAYRGPLQSL